MPGLVGLTHTASTRDEGAAILDAMLCLLRHAPFYRDDGRLTGPELGAGRCLAAPLSPEEPPLVGDGLYAWCSGELYNRQELASQAQSDAQHLALLCRNTKRQDDLLPSGGQPSCEWPGVDLSGLAALDGLFNAAVYDRPGRRLVLLSDRYGLRPLYWTRWRGGLAWAAEYKAFLALPGFAAQLDRRALESFLALGHLNGDRTWFDGVERLPAATALVWDLDLGTLVTKRYWSWDRVEAVGGRLESAADELAQLFRRAVERRCGQEAGPVGLSLSGGLDSRAILAAMPGSADPVPLLTFGEGGSQPGSDSAIAAAVARRRPTRHHWVELGGEDWLTGRLAAVWWTDGMLDIRHMHGVEALGRIRQTYAVGLNGAGGDGLAGGGYLFAAEDFTAHLSGSLGFNAAGHTDLAADLAAYFSRVGSAHAFYIDHRMRSFTLYGPLLATFAGVEYRLPFMDNAFQERLFAAPLAHKVGNRLYRCMLLRAFPDYFRRIPWQSTGVPLSWPPWTGRLVRRWRRPPLADYAAWIRRPPARETFARLLAGAAPLCAAYVAPDQMRQTWARHLQGQDHSDLLCRWLTLEVFLRQTQQQEWRPSSDTSVLNGI
jgi:asparagine synthase (glutamine-hydrolysing)